MMIYLFPFLLIYSKREKNCRKWSKRNWMNEIALLQSNFFNFRRRKVKILIINFLYQSLNRSEFWDTGHRRLNNFWSIELCMKEILYLKFLQLEEEYWREQMRELNESVFYKEKLFLFRLRGCFKNASRILQE